MALHRVRQGFVKARTAQANQIRGLLGEFGLIVPQGIGYIATRIAPITPLFISWTTLEISIPPVLKLSRTIMVNEIKSSSNR